MANTATLPPAPDGASARPAYFSLNVSASMAVAGLDGFEVFKLGSGDDAFAFVPDVHEDFFGSNFDDGALDYITSSKGQCARLLHGFFHCQHKQ